MYKFNDSEILHLLIHSLETFVLCIPSCNSNTYKYKYAEKLEIVEFSHNSKIKGTIVAQNLVWTVLINNIMIGNKAYIHICLYVQWHRINTNK